jgi:hypothetical protein
MPDNLRRALLREVIKLDNTILDPMEDDNISYVWQNIWWPVSPLLEHDGNTLVEEPLKTQTLEVC